MESDRDRAERLHRALERIDNAMMPSEQSVSDYSVSGDEEGVVERVEDMVGILAELEGW